MENDVIKEGRKYDVAELLKLGLIVFFFLMLVIGIWGLYSSLNQIISIWFNYKYAALYRAMLNVGVVVVVFYVLMRLVEEYRKKD
jgi:TRAP-type C4-dicarboxylate transport system permease small subunit